MKFNKENFLNKGFVEHKSYKDYCTLFLQKKVRSQSNEVSYFINIELFNIGSIQSVAATARLYTKEASSFGIDITIDPNEVKDVETFFAEMYTSLNCIPDPHNN